MKITKFFALLCAAATLSIVGCEPAGEGDELGTENNGGGNEIVDKNGISFSVNKTTVVINEPIVFTIKDNGTDVTAESKIYDKATYTEVANPLTIAEDGKYEFYAVYGATITKVIAVSVVPSIPALPEDSDPNNTSFNHHVLLVDHTGTNCGYCPLMMKAIRDVAAMPGYHEKFYEVMAHTYNTDDPSYSRAAEIVKTHYNSLIKGYPTATFNFYHPTAASYYASEVKSQIDALWKAEGADAGVAASTSGGNTVVVVNAEVKAKVAGDYRITAWLLEDGIYAPQNGTTDTSFYTHNNSLRNIAISDPLTGYSLGTLEAGEKKAYEMALQIPNNSGWKSENLKVLVIVTARNSNNRYEVANMNLCPINDSVGYDYME